ncbi:hypothetical protein BC834DRAFT_27085 [Gloeopeniophorella convolvens]|nr:hypothetical protein BC834DRAFT_27085 [Gloeopeniophorella convolvens]
MSQNSDERQPYPLRLPSYRSLHQGRYHPYPTFNREQGSSSQGDYEFEMQDYYLPITAQEAGSSTQASDPPPAAAEQTEPDLTNLAIVVGQLEPGATPANAAAPRTYVDIVIAFASAMRRRALAGATGASPRS